jgi:hypothetical protein|tara:strand:- start:2302 stop:2670 length:369 start_codon:yes stop_codon:yes gene_type:complete
MIIESFGILCIVTITGCINYNYYSIFKNDYEYIKSDKENIKNIIKKELVDKSTQVEKILDNNQINIEKIILQDNNIKNDDLKLDSSGNIIISYKSEDSLSIHSSDSFSSFSTINSELSYEKE